MLTSSPLIIFKTEAHLKNAFSKRASDCAGSKNIFDRNWKYINFVRTYNTGFVFFMFTAIMLKV